MYIFYSCFCTEDELKQGSKSGNPGPIRKICPLFKLDMRGARSAKWPQRWRAVGKSSYTLEVEPTNSSDWGRDSSKTRGSCFLVHRREPVQWSIIFLIMYRIWDCSRLDLKLASFVPSSTFSPPLFGQNGGSSPSSVATGYSHFPSLSKSSEITPETIPKTFQC